LAPTFCPGWPAEIGGSIIRLEWEPGTGRPELRALFDLGSGSTAVTLLITSRTMESLRSGVEVDSSTLALVDKAQRTS
jgi:hypothetical protein